MEYFAEDEDYTAPMFRSAAEEVTFYAIQAVGFVTSLLKHKN